MDEPAPRTEVPDVTPPPLPFVAVTWVGVFSIVLYGMFLLFGGGRRSRPPDGP